MRSCLVKTPSSKAFCGLGMGRQSTGRPSARSKCSIVFIATAYTICWWNCGFPSAGAHPSCASSRGSSRFTGS
jgi:hypothetical protein